MVDTIRSRLNHYQLLGISPTASGDEITRAFAREGSVHRPHAFGVLAELCIAYETLRDPSKRRAYDASIGLERKPSLQNVSAGARQALMARGPVAAVPLGQPTPAKAPPPTSQSVPQRNPEPPTKPALPLRPGADLNIRPEPRIGRASPPRIPLEEELGVEARPIDWRRTGTALGALVVAVCTLGGLAGWWSASGVSEAAQPENAVSVSLPPAKTSAAPPPPAVAPLPAPSLPQARIAAGATATRIEHTPTAPEPAAVEVQPQEDQADQNLSEQAAMEAPAALTVATPMPLPNRVIAQTIHRIGYSCGTVASTVPIEGEGSGVYKVTCSSGQSYQAKPVNGRYHFRRWGRR